MDPVIFETRGCYIGRAGLVIGRVRVTLALARALRVCLVGDFREERSGLVTPGRRKCTGLSHFGFGYFCEIDTCGSASSPLARHRGLNGFFIFGLGLWEFFEDCGGFVNGWDARVDWLGTVVWFLDVLVFLHFFGAVLVSEESEDVCMFIIYLI